MPHASVVFLGRKFASLSCRDYFVGTWNVSDIQLEATLITKLPTIRLITAVPTFISLISFMWSNISKVAHPLLCCINESHFRKRLGRDFLLFVLYHLSLIMFGLLFHFVFVSTQLIIRKIFSTHYIFIEPRIIKFGWSEIMPFQWKAET